MQSDATGILLSGHRIEKLSSYEISKALKLNGEKIIFKGFQTVK